MNSLEWFFFELKKIQNILLNLKSFQWLFFVNVLYTDNHLFQGQLLLNYGKCHNGL